MFSEGILVILSFWRSRMVWDSIFFHVSIGFFRGNTYFGLNILLSIAILFSERRFMGIKTLFILCIFLTRNTLLGQKEIGFREGNTTVGLVSVSFE